MPRFPRYRWRSGKPLVRSPTPHLPILLRSMHPARLADHYYNAIQDDAMYMTYHHEFELRAPPRPPNVKYDLADPYMKHRHNVIRGGLRIGNKAAPVSTAENVIKLEKIALHCMVKEAITNRNSLVPAIMAFRVLSGETYQGGGSKNREGLQIIKGRKSEHGWLRPGVPCGVKVEMTGDRMYEFLGTLVNFVLPRLREFSGVVLPPESKPQNTPAGISGVVSFGLPPHAMAFFPQIEVNVDAYPKMYGFHIHFITNAKGVGAQMRARTLLSGFQIPFIRS